MPDISNKFLRPNQDDEYYAQLSQVFYGLWTPHGILSPIFIGIWPNGSVEITYNMRNGAEFTETQKKKVEYVEQRGVEVTISHVNAEGRDE